MIQEILTYMILGSAITFAIIKARNKFWRKKGRKYNADSNKNPIQHNCSDCVADCMLRNISTPIIQNNNELCKKIEIKPDH